MTSILDSFFAVSATTEGVTVRVSPNFLEEQSAPAQGDGVVGEQPLLKPGESHDYVSGCPLPTPSGMMEGQYRFIREDGTTFLAEIPRFTLVAPAIAR